MSPEECSLVEGVQSFLAQLRLQTRSISTSENVLLQIKQCMAEATADVQSLLNARQPLLSLPTELLQKIMAFIPDAVVPPFLSSTRPVWHVDLYDTTMIIPISQTCKRLRNIAMGCPSLWTSVADGTRALSQSLAQRAQSLPMNAFLPVGKTQDYDLTAVVEDLPGRVRELHIGQLPCVDTEIVLHRMFSQPLPMLESLSVHFRPGENPVNQDGAYSFTLCPPQTCIPKLRRLHLYSCDLVSSGVLSSLTHLALVDIQIQQLHVRIRSILSVCIALQSLHLDSLTDKDYLRVPLGFSLPKPAALPGCLRLRRVSLRRVDSYLVSFISSLVLADQGRLVLQLLEIWGGPFYPHLPSGISRLAIGRYHSPQSAPVYRFLWGMTACGSRHTLRTAASILLGTSWPLVQDDTAALADTRELWLTDVSAHTSLSLSPNQIIRLKAGVAAMHSLNTVVLANHFQATRALSGRPSLFLLPDARDAIAWPRITTVRIVYGHGPRIHEEGAPHERPVRAVHPLDLTAVLDELASGAYDYLKHLVIEVPSGVHIEAGDVARLRGYFETTQVRVVDEMPAMALPEYCVEPEAWPRDVDEPWPYRIW